ncbi:CLUMA_CG017772, isoform A [Clunio marinus]|uniref:CLUMA_CG017772, isoform A n=1 Tax=Clunio marinus TaxID=568069 RepID=A0A1J1IX84_9DIPT|nr:CLUMA_CG017772, isoform A [Clunio marinus]
MTTTSNNESTRTPLSVVKFLELSLAICCTYFHFYSFSDDDLVTEFLATGTFCGYVIILTAIMADWIAGYLMKANINKRIMLFYSLLGSALFITSGVFIIQSWDRAFRTRTRDLAMTKGVVSIINGVIFFMDTIFTFRQKK